MGADNNPQTLIKRSRERKKKVRTSRLPSRGTKSKRLVKCKGDVGSSAIKNDGEVRGRVEKAQTRFSPQGSRRLSERFFLWGSNYNSAHAAHHEPHSRRRSRVMQAPRVGLEPRGEPASGHGDMCKSSGRYQLPMRTKATGDAMLCSTCPPPTRLAKAGM